MANMIISTFSMFLPQRTLMFCMIGLCIIFFGIYIPYEERKKNKKKKNQFRKQETERHTVPESEKRRLEQLKTLKDAGLLSEAEYQEKKREIR